MDKTIGVIVFDLLKKYPDARNRDDLIAALWLRSNGIAFPTTPEALGLLTNLKSVWRWRRKIQNDWGNFPADTDVQAKRGVLRKEWSDWAVNEK